MIKNLRFFVLTVSMICLGLLIAYAIKLSKQGDDSISGKIDIRDGKMYKGLTDELYSGIFRDTVGNKIIEYDVVQGARNGRFNVYRKDGTPQVLGYIKNNRNHGQWKYFSSSGILECFGHFKNDIITDKWTWFYPNGKIKEEGFYINGVREGNWVKYNAEGTVIARISFKKDVIIDELRAEKFFSL